MELLIGGVVVLCIGAFVAWKVLRKTTTDAPPAVSLDAEHASLQPGKARELVSASTPPQAEPSRQPETAPAQPPQTPPPISAKAPTVTTPPSPADDKPAKVPQPAPEAPQPPAVAKAPTAAVPLPPSAPADVHVEPLEMPPSLKAAEPAKAPAAAMAGTRKEAAQAGGKEDTDDWLMPSLSAKGGSDDDTELVLEDD